MRRLNGVCYDLEIVRCVPDRDAPNDPQYEYCQGWHDKAGMGISVLCAVDLYTGRPHIFLEDNLDAFHELVAARQHLIGFNSKQFDDKVVEAVTGRPVTTTYDLSLELRAALPKEFRAVRGGRTLDEVARVNLIGVRKSGHGADAPKEWQRKEYGHVIDYCMNDVFVLVRLLAKLPTLIDPVSGQTLEVRDIRETSSDPAQQALAL